MSAQMSVKRTDRFALFWGGGLGDILVVRPLLQALAASLEQPPYFFTTASHLGGLFEEFGLRADLRILPAQPVQALKLFRKFGIRFDWLYLGPYPRIKTRALAQVVGARRVWSSRHVNALPFIGEQVLADLQTWGLDGFSSAPYGGIWPTILPMVRQRPFVVFHPGAKDRWETTRWPDERWAQLMRRVLEEGSVDIVLVGTGSEKARLDSLREAGDGLSSGRVQVQADLSLRSLAGLIAASRGVVCHNSGVLHLSAMLGRPTIAVTGSSALYWRPPYAHVHNISSGACNLACNQYRCPVPFYRARCIRELQTDAVMAAVRGKLLVTSG